MTREAMRRSREKLRLEALERYGRSPPRCANPYGWHEAPFVVIELLEVWRKGEGGGARAYSRLRADGWPRGGVVLCRNCAGLRRLKRRRDGGGRFGSSVRVTRGGYEGKVDIGRGG